MNFPLVILIALTIVWMAATASGVTLLLLGLRRRRADFLRRCRGCRYVIDGGFDSAVCPECGTDIRESGTVLVGRRRVNEPQLAFGTILLLIGAAPVVVMVVKGARATTVAGAIATGPAMNTPTARSSTPANVLFASVRGRTINEPVNLQASAPDSRNSDLNAKQLSLLEHAGLHTAFMADRMPDDELAPSTDAIGSVVELPELTSLGMNDAAEGSPVGPARRQPAGVGESVLAGTLLDFSKPQAKWNASDPFDVDPLTGDLLQLPSIGSLIGPAVRYDAPAATASSWSGITATTSDSMQSRVKSSAIKPARIGQRSR